jgi:hypothetical protein
MFPQIKVDILQTKLCFPQTKVHFPQTKICFLQTKFHFLQTKFVFCTKNLFSIFNEVERTAEDTSSLFQMLLAISIPLPVPVPSGQAFKKLLLSPLLAFIDVFSDRHEDANTQYGGNFPKPCTQWEGTPTARQHLTLREF